MVVTKSDKLKPMRRAKRLKELVAQLERKGTKVVATSAQTRQGIDDVWRVIHQRVASEA